MNLCPVCEAPSQLKCSGCTSSVSPVYYCSRHHQKQHWKHHKKECLPIVEGCGNGGNDDKIWIASRDICEGSIIVQELPAISGPRLIPADIGGSHKYFNHVCLGCSGPLGLVVDPKKICTKCTWPVCGPECEKTPLHADNECQFLAKEGITYQISTRELEPPFAFVGICTLRGMFLKNRDPLLWKKIMATFQEKYCSGRFTDTDKKNCFRTRTVFKAEPLGDYEDWSKIFSMVVGNCFKENGLPAEKPIQEVAIYPVCNFFSHTCRPNAESTRRRVDVNSTSEPRWTPNKYGSTVRMKIQAIRPITKGEPITVRFSMKELFYGTEQRLAYQKRRCIYICSCERCSDPTELGTFSSAIKCKYCSTGYMLPSSFFDEKAPFICSVCKQKKNREKVLKFITKLHQDLLPEQPTDDEVEDMERYEEFIDRNSGTVLHPNHWLLQEAMRGFCLALDPAYSETAEDAEKCLTWGRQLIHLRETLTPGLTIENAQIYLRVSSYGLLDLRNKRGTLTEEEIQKRYAEMHDWSSKALKYWLREEEQEGGGGGVGVGVDGAAAASTTNTIGHSEQQIQSLLDNVNARSYR